MCPKKVIALFLILFISSISNLNAGESKKVTITGKITDANGEPVTNAVVAIRGARAKETSTNVNGRFSTTITSRDSLVPKPYLQIRHIERNLASVVELDENSENLDIKLSTGVIFSGKVVDANDVGIQDAKIVLYFMITEGGYEGGGSESIKIGPKGNFEIRAIPKGHGYSVGISAEGYGQRFVRFHASDAIGGRVERDPFVLAIANKSVSGIVVDIDDKPVAEARVSCYTYPQPNRSTKTDTKGKFILENICSGKIDIQANKKNSFGRVSTVGGAKDVKITILERDAGNKIVIKQPPSLIGKSLPDMKNIVPDSVLEQTKGKELLLCLLDINQRPSRNCILQLSKKSQELKKKNVIIVAIQTSKVEKAKLDEWIKENSIPFPVGMIAFDEEKTSPAWGVKSLPWLILTDKKHVVVAEGFSLDELDEKITTLNEK